MEKNQKHKLTKEDIFKNLVGCIDTPTEEKKKPKSIWKLEISNYKLNNKKEKKIKLGFKTLSK